MNTSHAVLGVVVAAAVVGYIASSGRPAPVLDMPHDIEAGTASSSPGPVDQQDLEDINASSTSRVLNRVSGSSAHSPVAERAEVEWKEEVKSSWGDAKPHFRDEFIMSERRKAGIGKEMFRLRASEHELLVEDVYLDSDEPIEWAKVVQDGSSLSEKDRQDLDFLQSEIKGLTAQMSEDAGNFAAHSLLEYYEHDMAHIYPRDSTGRPGKAAWGTKGGEYNMAFITDNVGWEVLVNFDSIDFPFLNDLLLEGRRMKTDFYESLASVLKK